MVTFRVFGIPTGIHLGEVVCEDLRLKRILEPLSKDFIEEELSPADGDPDWALALFLVERWGGRIIRGDPVTVEPDIRY